MTAPCSLVCSTRALQPGAEIRLKAAIHSSRIAYVSRSTSEIVDSQTQKSSTYGSSIPYQITGQRVVPVRENALDPGIGFDTHRPYSISMVTALLSRAAGTS